MANADGHDPGGGETLRGASLILAVGLALGFAYNAVGLASRPPHGLAWVAHPPAIPSVEALQPVSGAPASTAAAVPAGPRPDAPHPAPSSATTTPPAPPKPAASRGVNPPGAETRPAGDARPAGAAPNGSGAAPGPATPATAAPAQTPAPTPPAAPPSPDVPVIPDVPGPLKLEIATLKKLYDANAALVVDAREADEYADGHIAGATSLPYNDAMADPDRAKRLDSGGRPIVVYCSGGTCELSTDLARLLVQSGKRRVLVYEGGFPEWQAAGYPVAKGASPGARP